jgi:peptidyl-prolyl cis-trans isomerase C
MTERMLDVIAAPGKLCNVSQMRISRLIVALLLLPVLHACKPAKKKGPQDNADLGQVVAKVDDTLITVGDVQERINKQSPFIRARYTTVDKKKEFLDNIIRFEVMAKEAQRRGYDKDPEVVRVMKQQMISKFLQKDFESKLKVEDVPDADVEKYYKANPNEFNKADEVRASQIFLKDKAKADKAYAEAKAAPKGDEKAFRDLVAKYSEDEDSKQRAGDLTFFDKNSTMYPKPVIEATFKLAAVGDLSPPVKSDKGYHIIRLTQKRPGFNRPLPEVKRQIQQRLFRDMRTKALDDFIADMKKKTKIEIHEEKLAKVAIESGVGGAEAGPGMGARGAAPGMGMGAHGSPMGPGGPGGPMAPGGMAMPPAGPRPATPPPPPPRSSP